MTAEQAQREMARLYFELGFRKDNKGQLNPNIMTPELTAAWLKSLQAMPYEKGRMSVDAVRDAWESGTRFPTVGFLNKKAQDIGYDGHPNAIPYSQDGHTPWSKTDKAMFSLFVTDKLARFDLPIPLPDEVSPEEAGDMEIGEQRYWAYVQDKGYRGRTLDLWRQEWANEGRRTA